MDDDEPLSRPLSDLPLFLAHKRSSHHREEILASEACGCFSCLAMFPSIEIRDWVDEFDSVGYTATCPRCGIDSVIGMASGYPITQEFLLQMKARFFGPD